MSAAATNFAVGGTHQSVVVGDFNGDGPPDLAVANFGTQNVSVPLGNGLRGFAAATNFKVGRFSSSVAIGDFNGDGPPDLTTANCLGAQASVLLQTCQ